MSMSSRAERGILQAQELRKLLARGRSLVVPDAFDVLSARLIELHGFEAVQCSGHGMALAAYLLPETELSLEQNLEQTRRIVDAVAVPVMADGEDGYGDAEATRRTVTSFIDIGAAGINLEDQERGGHSAGVRVISEPAMLEKLAAAKEARATLNPRFVINARTDALRASTERLRGLAEAVRRANLFLEAGADLAFVCYVATLSEVETVVREVGGPVSLTAGMPYSIASFSVRDLVERGVARISLPVLLLHAAVRAMNEVLRELGDTGGFVKMCAGDRLATPDEAAAVFSRR